MQADDASKLARKGSRTNQEMSDTTKAKLLDATLDCLSDVGYAATSTNEVVRRAGLTRGALTHHFASKAILVAEAAALLVKRRQLDQQELYRLDIAGTLGARIRQKHEITKNRFPAMIEFMIAARTNDKLQNHFLEAISRHFPADEDTAGALFPEFESRPDPTITHYMVNCFIRGLLLENLVNSEELVEEIFNEFIDLLTMALSKNQKS